MSDQDPFANLVRGPLGPYTHGADITLNDTTELTVIPTALMATTTAGKVTVVTIGGDT